MSMVLTAVSDAIGTFKDCHLRAKHTWKIGILLPSENFSQDFKAVLNSEREIEITSFRQPQV